MSISKDLKLTKTGEKLSRANKDELEKYFKKLTSKNYEKLRYNELLGLSINPLLTSEQIKIIIELIQKVKTNDRKKIKIINQVVDQLALHSSLKDPDLIEFLVLNMDALILPSILYNPNITEEHLDKYFRKRVMYDDDCDTSRFKELMKIKKVTPELALKWYNELKKFAEWEFTGFTWDSIIDGLLDYEDCPFEILEDIIKSIKINDVNKQFVIDNYIKKIVNHKNSSDELKMIAYKKTGLVEFLPQVLKDIFIF